MTDPFIGEVRMFGFNYAPNNWAKCDGQLLPIDQHNSLYSILGTTYGGDGRTTFALPELRGRSPIHTGGVIALGAKQGTENVNLVPENLPRHFHPIVAANIPALTNDPTDNRLAHASVYAEPDPLAPMSTHTIGSTGGGQAHNNMQPYLVINFCICLQGIYPPQN